MQRLLIAALFGLLTSGPALAGKDDVVYGYGLQSCASYLQAHKTSKKNEYDLEWLSYMGWLSGYFSGLNTQAIVGGAPPRSVPNLSGYLSVVTDKCRETRSRVLWEAGFLAFVALPEGELTE